MQWESLWGAKGGELCQAGRPGQVGGRALGRTDVSSAWETVV